MRKYLSLCMVICILCCSFALAEAPDTEPVPVRYGITNIKGVNMRSKASAKADAVQQIPIAGTPVTILEDVMESGVTWYKVDYEGDIGFIRADLIDEVLPTDEEKYAETAAAIALATAKALERKGSAGNVWIPTNGGTKYHASSSCSNMKAPKKVTLEYAKSHGYTACKKCKP